MNVILTKAPEQGSYDLTVTLEVTPVTLYWSLKDGAGTEINGRTDVEITSPGTTNVVKLSGDDLAIFTDEPEEAPKRYIYISGTWLDGGSTRDISEECVFVVDDFVSVGPVARS